MSISHKLGLALGMEDDAPNVQVNIDTDEGGMPLDDVVATDDGDFEPTPEADAAEITERAEEIEEDNDDIEDMEVATESLIATYEAMAIAQRNGGLTREAATFAAISVESVMGKYDVGHEDVGISLESFDDNKSRATTISMEGIGQALKDLWEAIVKKFKEMIKKIVDFYQKAIAAAPRIKRRAEGLKKKAQKTTGSPKETKIKTGLFGALNIQGEVPQASTLIAGLNNLKVTFEANCTKDEFRKSVTTLFSVDTFGKNFDEAALATTVGKIVSDIKNAAKSTGHAPSGFKYPQGVAVHGIPGNKAFVIDQGTKADGAGVNSEGITNIVSNLTIGVVEDKPGVKNDKDAREKEFTVLDTKDVEKICDVIIINMNELISFKTQANASFDQAKLMEKEGEKAIAKISKNEDSKGNEATARRYLNAMASLARKAQTAQANVVRLNYQVSKAALAYCARSLSQYKN